MIKKFLLLSLVVSQLTISCSSDDSTDPVTDPVTEEPKEPIKDQTLAEQIAALLKQPYSALTPAEQKVKAEAEANEMLVQLDKTKTSGAIEALENLGRLLDLSSIDIFDGKNGNKVEDILNISGVYGIYTWNNTQSIWVKTPSSTELKFIFPAKSSQTTNNASFSAKSVSSDIKVKFEDSYGYWVYNEATKQSEYVPGVNDHIFLPLSADATLAIDSKEAATFTQTAKYANGKQVPTEFAFKMTLNDGYVWQMSSTKAAENTAKASLTYNGKTLLEFNAGSSANIDGLIDNDKMVQYRGKANGVTKLMDNFVIVADMDLADADAADAALEKSVVFPELSANSDTSTFDFKAYYTSINTYELKRSEGSVANFNKNIKLILVSKKDGTKIADIVQRSEKDSYNSYFTLPVWKVSANYENGGYWSFDNNGEQLAHNYYQEVNYLKFNDNTEVEMAAYFSKGFEKFEAKFEDFVKAFQK